MSKSIKKTLIAGAIIASIGLVIMLIGLSTNGWSYSEKYDIKTYTADFYVHTVTVKMDAGTVKTEFYDDDKITVEYPDGHGYVVTFKNNNGNLYIDCDLKWYMNFGFHIGNTIPATTVKLPKDVAYAMKFDINAGTLNLADGTYGALTLDMDAGTFKAGNITCTTFNCDINAGTAKVENLDCLSVICDFDAGTLKIGSTTAGTLKITMDAGSAKIGLAGAESEYTIITKVSAGSCNVSNRTGTTDKRIDIDLDAGSIKLEFNQ